MNTLKSIKDEKQKRVSSENDLMMSQTLKMELDVIKKNSKTLICFVWLLTTAILLQFDSLLDSPMARFYCISIKLSPME